MSAQGRYLLLGLALLGLFAIFWSTAWSMVSIWWRSETFAHGFFIVPISLFVTWRLRPALAQVPLRTDFRALAVLAALGLGWMLAAVVDVQVVKQLALVAMIPAVSWLLLGWRAVWVLAFPLGFLLFAVPIGEGLIPPLMKFTAAFTVEAVRLSGIPVFADGFFIWLPGSTWSIVEGCSGVRYLIASITLGTLYAYLTYQSFWRRAAFVGLSIIAPIIANGFRAYMIVMLGHLSDMRLAVGVDHLIYGWVFFGVVMLILFWIGTFWREPDPDPAPEPRLNPGPAEAETGTLRPIAGLFAGLLVVAVWPAWGAYLDHRDRSGARVSLAPPEAKVGWASASGPFTEWRPRFIGPSDVLERTYQRSGERVGIYFAYYRGQDQDAELVNSQNVMVEQKHPVWRHPYERKVSVTLGEDVVTVVESNLKSREQELLAWHWYWLGGHHTSNPYEAKLREALAKVLGQTTAGSGVVVFTEVGEGLETARATLQRYLDDMFPAIEATLQRAAGG